MVLAYTMSLLVELLSSRVKAEIFRLLFRRPDAELHLRELTRQTGLTVGTVRQELQRLTRLGITEARKDGNRICYRANPKHPLYPDLRNLVLKTSGLADVLGEALEHPGIRLAFVFGSIARNEDRAHSDVDLMVIGDITLRQLTKLLSGVSARIGREINPHAMNAEEFTRRKKARDHFITTVLAAPKLFVKANDDELKAMG
jgi:predicted nucleotidyltransferase